jgi:tripartite-type tricarboxylate transporter receptor subunit TctC
MIVENITGAGGLIAANQVYKAFGSDGLTVAHLNGGLLFNQILEQPGIEFESLKFFYLGAPTKENTVLFVTKASGITNLNQLMAARAPVKLGATGVGSYSRSVMRIWKEACGMPVQIIGPYKGGAEIRLAADAGEVAGSVLAWDAMRSSWEKRFASGSAYILLQAVQKPMHDLPKVPVAMQIAKTEEARQLTEVGIYLNNTFSRPFALGPGVPRDRAELLRSAFEKTMKDKEFIDECEKAKLSVDAVSGEEVERAVANASKISRPLAQKLKEIVFK